MNTMPVARWYHYPLHIITGECTEVIVKNAMAEARRSYALIEVLLDGQPVNCLLVNFNMVSMDEIKRKYYSDDDRVTFRCTCPVDGNIKFDFYHDGANEEIGILHSGRTIYTYMFWQMVSDFLDSRMVQSEPYFYSALSWARQESGKPLTYGRMYHV